jgi:transcriptional regulator with PAS, ATPase and Fis domain
VPINCSALPENLLESELFGHRRGSFTGAINDKKGLFQEADGGTIFLDEIGTMPAMLQSRLLRVLQEREVRRVGDNTPFHVNVRVLAATNEPLEKRIKDGTFREDLYYRLNVIPIQLPSLRERKEDVPLLVRHFLHGKLNPRTHRPYKLSRHALNTLVAYNWPGNVRELENAIERAATLCDEERIQSSDLPPNISAACQPKPADEEVDATLPDLPEGAAGAASGNGSASAEGQPGSSVPLNELASLKNYLREQEHAYLDKVMEQCGGDKEKAALVLGVSLATLYRKISGEEKD